MTDSYLVHLPDGTEYGPIDRATLEAWHGEGRLPAASLVWPHGAPEWKSVEAVLGGASRAAETRPVATPAAPATVRVTPAAAKPRPVAPATKADVAPASVKPVAAPAIEKATAAPPAARPAAAPAPAKATAAPAAAKAVAAPASAKAAAAPTSAKPVAAPTPAKPTAAPAAAKAVAAPAAKPAAAPASAAKPAPEPSAARQAPASSAPPAVEPPDDHGTDTRPRVRSPYVPREKRARRPAPDPALLRRLLWAGVAIVVVLAVLGALVAVLRPLLQRSQEIAAVRKQALPERHIEDGESGLVADLPSGWYALRADNTFVSLAGARLYLAQPTLSAFGAVTVTRPRLVDAVDAYLDDLLQQRQARRPGSREESRSDVQLGRGRGRLVRSVWQDGARPMVAATVAWVDGYEMLTLETWAPASAGSQFSAQLEELCKGLRASGALEARVTQAVDRLALEVPELSPDVLRLLIAERMGRNAALENVPSEALLMVSRGLDVLTPAEAEEMRVIYQQVWEPVPETERERMAALLREIRAGRQIPAADLQLLREALKAGMLALAPEQRTRLQQLSGRAVRRALARP